MSLHRYAAAVAVVLLGSLAGCGGEQEVHPQAFLTQVRAEGQPRTSQLDDALLIQHAERICGEVDSAAGWLRATMKNYQGVPFGDNPTLIDAAVESYCPEVGAKVNDQFDALSSN